MGVGEARDCLAKAVYLLNRDQKDSAKDLILRAQRLLDALGPHRDLDLKRDPKPTVLDEEVAQWLQSSFFTSPLSERNSKLISIRPLQMFKMAVNKIILKNRVIRRFSSGTLKHVHPVEKMLFDRKVREEVQKSGKWEFDVFKFNELTSGNALLALSWHCFNDLELIEDLTIPRGIFVEFFSKIQKGYLDIPYHNSIHASDVFATVFYFLKHESPILRLNALDKMCMLIAAAIHDYKHPGVNNTFLVNSGSDLALLYNDVSVLENYHLSEAFKEMKRFDCDILSVLSARSKSICRKKIISMVLATDMCYHADYLREAEFHIKSGSSIDSDMETKRQQCFMDFLIHMADLANATRSWEIAYQWANRVLSEFFSQGDREKALGLTVSPMMVRDHSETFKGRAQSGFLDYVVLPMMGTAEILVPAISEANAIGKSNRDRWNELARGHT
jgi:hypothetical protein